MVLIRVKFREEIKEICSVMKKEDLITDDLIVFENLNAFISYLFIKQEDDNLEVQLQDTKSPRHSI